MNICNNLKSIRNRLGLSQQDLANIAGVTRQSIGGIESGQYAPSVTICLRLAKALGCEIEELFWLEEELPKVEAILTKPVCNEQQSRVSLARVGDQLIAYPLVGNDAFRVDMVPADAEVVAVERLPGIISKPSLCEGNLQGEAHSQAGTNKVLVRLLDDIDKLHNTVVIAGCTPVLSLLARATERWHPQLRVHYHFAHSMAALRSLCRGEVHIAGMHLYDPQTGEHNISFAREALIGKSAVLITLGVWEEGLLVLGFAQK